MYISASIFTVRGDSEIESSTSSRLFQRHRIGSAQIDSSLSPLNAVTAHIAAAAIGELAKAKARQ
jgi:hypothetical protein